MDTVGAMIGPLVAFAMLAAAPVAFNSIFMVSFCIALLGVGILVLFVDQRRTAGDAGTPARAASMRGATRLLRDARYRRIVLAGGALSLATASDAFVFLALQRKLGLGNAVFPLLFTGSALTFMLLAVPMGRLADRIGRGRVLVGGYVVLLAVYAVVVAPLSGSILLVLALGLLGTYYAATDGVLMAFASGVVPEDVRGTGLALLGTTTNVARLLASVAFGALWTLVGMTAAFACFGGALMIAIAIAAILFGRAARTA
jgi:MFS family permease